MKQMTPFKQRISLLALIGIAGMLTSCIHAIHRTPVAENNAAPIRPGLLYKIRSKIFPQKKSPPQALVPLWMGTISLVDMEKGFVLIDSNALYAAVPGKELRCLSKERETAKLRISGEKNPPFFIADIVSGVPHVGDRVYVPDHP